MFSAEEVAALWKVESVIPSGGMVVIVVWPLDSSLCAPLALLFCVPLEDAIFILSVEELFRERMLKMDCLREKNSANVESP